MPARSTDPPTLTIKVPTGNCLILGLNLDRNQRKIAPGGEKHVARTTCRHDIWDVVGMMIAATITPIQSAMPKPRIMASRIVQCDGGNWIAGRDSFRS